MADEERERALSTHVQRKGATPDTRKDFRAGYDAARAKYERKVEEFERRLEQVDAGRVAYAARAEKAEARVRELEISRAVVVREYGDAKVAFEAALATERERNAAMRACLQRLDRRGGLGLDEHEWIRQALSATTPDAAARKIGTTIDVRMSDIEPDTCEQCGGTLHLICYRGCD